MDILNFQSGGFTKQYNYSSFTPSKVNIDWGISDISLIDLLSRANLKLGELHAFSQLVPDIDFFIIMHVRKEANQSSKIEGTQTNIEDTLQKSENVNPEKKDDWQEVQNYISSINFAIDRLKDLPISTRLIKETHKILLTGNRGQHKQPGEYRSSQNWIGGYSLSDAVFIPPSHVELNELMNDLEKFINKENDKLPILIKTGIMHYQFETIHPFLDGNGRIGRLLITLYLISNGLLTKPCLYLSDYFEKNRSLYYEYLTRARTHNDLTQWLKFFLEGVFQTSENSIETFKNILSMKVEIETKLVKFGRRSKIAQALMNYSYSQPLFEPSDISKALNINISTANRLISDFVELNILREITGFKRNRIFVFSEYIELFNN